MVPTEKPLDNPINWSFKIARVWAIDVRVHIIFIIAAIVLVWMELPKEGALNDRSIGEVIVDSLGIYAILFTIVLLHEFGHCWGARKSGGEADEILIWPLGGLAMVKPPHDARSHLVTALAGPMVNVIICGLLSGVIALWAGKLGAVPWNPLHPMLPVDRSVLFESSTAQLWLTDIFGISYFLLLINMLPIFPFDGGRVLQAVLWPRKGYRESMMIATGTGMVGAILVGLVALFLDQSWLLLMIAVFGYMTCLQERRLAKEAEAFGVGEFGYDFSRGYGAFDSDDEKPPAKPGPIARWKAKRQEARENRERIERESHDADVEQILKKISESGMDSLTYDERHTLEMETRRKRSTN